MPNYAAPVWDAPIDGETYRRAVPSAATIKGMFPAAIVAESKRRGVVLAHAADKYLGFLDYPLTDYMRLLLEAAPVFYPGLPLRQGLRKIGRAAIGTFKQSTIGMAVFGARTQPDAVMQALGGLVRAYAIAIARPTPQMEVRPIDDTSCVLRCSDLWLFLDSHQIGVIEGLFKACGMRSEVLLWTEGLATGEFLFRWTRDSQPPPAPPTPLK